MLGHGIVGGLKGLPTEDETQIKAFLLSGAVLSIATNECNK